MLETHLLCFQHYFYVQIRLNVLHFGETHESHPSRAFHANILSAPAVHGLLYARKKAQRPCTIFVHDPALFTFQILISDQSL